MIWIYPMAFFIVVVVHLVFGLVHLMIDAIIQVLCNAKWHILLLKMSTYVHKLSFDFFLFVFLSRCHLSCLSLSYLTCFKRLSVDPYIHFFFFSLLLKYSFFAQFSSISKYTLLHPNTFLSSWTVNSIRIVDEHYNQSV